MGRILFGIFLVGHGLLHVPLWLTPSSEGETPFDPGSSWLLRRAGMHPRAMRRCSRILATVAAVTLVAAGAFAIANAGIWHAAVIAGAGSSLVLIALYFDRWLMLGTILDAGILSAVALNWAHG